MEIIGYKCFNKGLINRYGKKFEVGKIYISPGILKYGNKGNGFHMCKYIEDTFRFFDTTKKDICVCKVKGSGNFIKKDDDYYGYFDMYCVEKIEILKQLTREELIEIGLSLGSFRVKKFIKTFSLTPFEIDLFKQKYKSDIDILNTIAYHQEEKEDLYCKKIIINK